MSEYRTKDGDVLDAICAKYYPGQAGTVERVLETNPNLADYGTVLPSGIVIELPNITATPRSNVVTLW